MISFKRFSWIAATVALLLLIPFIAMQFSSEVHWSVLDFVVAGGLLLGTALACEFIYRKVQASPLKWLWIGLVLLVLVLIWAELAVGIFGSPLAGS
ncbi:MAG: hypothetical protein ACK4HE_01195 [Chitinophagaceae bacterium]